MDARSLERMAARLSSQAPSLPPSVELPAVIRDCEERIASMAALAAVGLLPERTVIEMRVQLDERTAAACLELRVLLSEMDFVLASVGLARGASTREDLGQGLESHADVSA